MKPETKAISLSELTLGEKQVIFPGEYVKVSSNSLLTLLEKLTPPAEAELTTLRTTGHQAHLHPSDTFVFVNTVVNGSSGDLGTIAKVIYPPTPNSSELPALRGLCRALVKTRLGHKQVKVEPLNEDSAAITNKMLQGLRQALSMLFQSAEKPGSSVYRALKLTEIVMTPSQIVDMVSFSFSFNPDTRFRLFNERNAAERFCLLMDYLNVFLVSLDKNPVQVSRPGNKALRLLPSIKPSSILSPGRSAVPSNVSVHAKKPALPPSRGDKIGEDMDDGDDDLVSLKARLNEALPAMPQEGHKVITRELKRIGRMNSQQTEYNVVLNYLETLADLPWTQNKPAVLTRESIAETKQCLDRDNYGLQDAKKRLVEYVAISYLRQQRKNQLNSNCETGVSPILLLVGPPGVGKTSLAKSVAAALKKQMYRISLGGVRDEAEIRGHRRTYIGSMPGVIVQALRKAGTMNPVLVLDEIDKVSHGNSSGHGDPSAALLEVLDPAQNNAFKDHYIDFPVDLSQVTFIATANSTSTISRPLLDRMEVIHIDGYTYQEKLHIAQQFLIPKQLNACGMTDDQLGFDKDALTAIITKYTRESGVRELERVIGSVCRGWAADNIDKVISAEQPRSDLTSKKNKKDENTTKHYKLLDTPSIRKYLGVEIYSDDVVNDDVDLINLNGKLQHRHTSGVVNGLAYMGSGMGGILVFEATLIPNGCGQLKLTGKLGEVMTESANIAISWVRSNAIVLNIPFEMFKEYDFHLHAPAGAIPKDGPSAGTAMTVCLVSLLTGRRVPRDLAMTGEMTLRGKVLPVGGVREKLLGAHTAGVRRVLLPYRCEATVAKEISKGVQFPDVKLTFVKYIWDVLDEVWPKERIGPSVERSQL